MTSTKICMWCKKEFNSSNELCKGLPFPENCIMSHITHDEYVKLRGLVK